MYEMLEFVHEQRKSGYTFSSIAGRLQAKYSFNITRARLNALYLKWCQQSGIEAVRDTRVYHYDQPPNKRNKIKISQEDLDKRNCMLHLLDLVRAHGELVTNRLTGEIVSGGFPNLNIPDVDTPIIITPSYNGSICGSAALTCAEFGK